MLVMIKDKKMYNVNKYKPFNHSTLNSFYVFNCMVSVYILGLGFLIAG